MGCGGQGMRSEGERRMRLCGGVTVYGGRWVSGGRRGHRDVSSVQRVRRAFGGHIAIRETFLTNSRTTSRRRTSSASRQSPSTSYVRRHSVTSAYSFDFSVSVTLPVFPCPPTSEFKVVAKRWSRSEDSVDLMRSTRYTRVRFSRVVQR